MKYFLVRADLLTKVDIEDMIVIVDHDKELKKDKQYEARFYSILEPTKFYKSITSGRFVSVQVEVGHYIELDEGDKRIKILKRIYG